CGHPRPLLAPGVEAVQAQIGQGGGGRALRADAEDPALFAQFIPERGVIPEGGLVPEGGLAPEACHRGDPSPPRQAVARSATSTSIHGPRTPSPSAPMTRRSPPTVPRTCTGTASRCARCSSADRPTGGTDTKIRPTPSPKSRESVRWPRPAERATRAPRPPAMQHSASATA